MEGSPADLLPYAHASAAEMRSFLSSQELAERFWPGHPRRLTMETAVAGWADQGRGLLLEELLDKSTLEWLEKVKRRGELHPG